LTRSDDLYFAIVSEYFDQLFSSNASHSVIIEDDGKVAYAYLLLRDKIVGDVWLYNQSATPLITDWSRKENMPFLNSAEFLKNSDEFEPIAGHQELNINWIYFDNSTLAAVEIFIRDRLIAILKPSEKPGWSTLVKKDGPLAKVILQ
jgi:hypothetical protein